MTAVRRLGVLVAAATLCVATLGQEPTRTWPDWLTPCIDGKARCGSYPVWEDRAAGSGRRIGLNVVVVPASGTADQQRPDPLFYFAGGPGSEATGLLGAMAGEPFRSINARRDVVLVDRRGTGGSHPLHCDLYGDEPAGWVAEFLPLEAVRRCARELALIADLRLYTSELAMDDIDEIRGALGYATINAFGVSYGTREAAVLLRRHPASVRSAILLGVADPGLHMPEPYAADTEQALNAVLAACAAMPECAASFPNPRAQIDALAARLEAGAVTVEVRNARLRRVGGSGTSQVQYGRDVFAEMIRYLLYSSESAALLPALVNQAHAGDWRPLVEWSVNQRDALAGNDGLFLSVTCAQDLPWADAAEVERLGRGTLLGRYRYDQQARACTVWPRGEVSADFDEPLRAHVPVLLLSGEFDPVTPAARAEALLPGLTDALHIVMPGAAHGLGGVENAECIDRAMIAFIEGGTAAVDSACTAGMRRTRFVDSVR